MTQYSPALKEVTDNILTDEFKDQASIDFLREWRMWTIAPRYNMFVMEVEEFDRFMQYNVRNIERLQGVIEASRTLGTYPTRAAAYCLEYLNGFYIHHAYNVRGFDTEHAAIRTA